MARFKSLFTRGRSLILLFALTAVSFGLVGGCDGNKDGGDDQGHLDTILLGDYQEHIRQELQFALGISDYEGQLNNVIFHCPDIDALTEKEKEIIRDAYTNKFVIVAYESQTPCVDELMDDVLAIPNFIVAVQQSGIEEGVGHDLFTMEHHEDNMDERGYYRDHGSQHGNRRG